MPPVLSDDFSCLNIGYGENFEPCLSLSGGLYKWYLSNSIAVMIGKIL